MNKEGKSYWLIYDFAIMPARLLAGSFQISVSWWYEKLLYWLANKTKLDLQIAAFENLY